ncbi:MAG: NADH-quinone oxidoreductase subunit I [bacterium]
MKLIKDIKALVTGLGITGKHLGRHAITIQYPEERWPMPERSRGIVVLLSDKETGQLNCTGCLLCEKACPTAAIRIEAPRDEKKKRHLKSFVVDHGLCCFCGLCEEACNFAALKMATKYEFSTENKDDLIWDMKKLQEVGLDVPYTPKPKKKPVAKPTAPKPPEAEKDQTENSSDDDKPKEIPSTEQKPPESTGPMPAADENAASPAEPEDKEGQS